jgi:hypothetical protein
MNWMTIESQIRVIGILAVLFTLYSLWMGQMKAAGLLSGYTSPVLALELAANGAEIDAINRSEGGKATEFIKKQLSKDFGYILIYVVFFSCLALLIIEVSSDWSKYLGWAAVVCAVIAGVFDVIENVRMLKATSTPAGAATDSLANSIRYPSLAKWALLFVFCLLVGLTLSRVWGWLLIPGLAFLIAALLGLSGVILNLLRPKFYWMFPASVGFMGLAIIFIAITFTFWPQKVLSKFFAAG